MTARTGQEPIAVSPETSVPGLSSLVSWGLLGAFVGACVLGWGLLPLLIARQARKARSEVRDKAGAGSHERA